VSSKRGREALTHARTHAQMHARARPRKYRTLPRTQGWREGNSGKCYLLV